jgi:16S rRNA (adenine1518-N6/adenine1519-N6)-dimethyltransferase
LSLMLAKKTNVSMQIFVWKNNFIPAPKVESAVLLFEKHNLYNEIDDKKFLDFIKKSFLSPRKKLIKNLSNFWFDKEKLKNILQKLWFNENTRPEEFNIDNFINLFASIY